MGAVQAASGDLVDFLSVSIAVLLVLSALLCVLAGSQSPPQSPTDLTSIASSFSWIMLVFFTPGAVTTYYTELFEGQPSVGGLPQLRSQASLFALVLVKLAVPALTCFTLKKFFWALLFRTLKGQEMTDGGKMFDPRRTVYRDVLRIRALAALRRVAQAAALPPGGGGGKRPEAAAGGAKGAGHAVLRTLARLASAVAPEEEAVTPRSRAAADEEEADFVAAAPTQRDLRRALRKADSVIIHDEVWGPCKGAEFWNF